MPTKKPSPTTTETHKLTNGQAVGFPQNRLPTPQQPQQLSVIATPETVMQVVNIIEAGTTQIAQALVPVAGGEQYAGGITIRNILRLTVED